MNQEEIIRGIIDAFFKGKESFETNIGFVWVAKHGVKEYNRFDTSKARQNGLEAPTLMSVSKIDHTKGYIAEFETLTIEPREGGQYEVAVRIWSENKWRGYKINDVSNLHSFYLVGVNTRGH